MPDPVPQIDFTRIDFPTDRLTVKDLRRLKPECFDIQNAPTQHPRVRTCGYFNRWSLDELENQFGGLVAVERATADRAFHKVLGLEIPDHLGDPILEESDREEMENRFVPLGLAAGKHKVRLLIRDIEAQAIAQAKKYLGPSRS